MRRAWLTSCLGALVLAALSLLSLVVLLVAILPGLPQPPKAAPTPSVYELPEAAPQSSLWRRAASIQLASGVKVSQATREERLRERLDELKGDNLPTVTVDQSHGVTVLMAADTVLATVLPEDLPEYASSLSPTERKQLEAALADNWRQHLQLELDLDHYMRGPGFRKFSLIFVGWTLLLAVAAHLLARYLGSRVLHSPAWSLKSLVWASWLAVTLSLFPEAADLRQMVTVGMLSPLFELFLVGAGSGVAMSLGKLMIQRYLEGLREHAPSQGARFDTRLATFEEASVFGLRLVVGVIACGVFLSRIGVDLRAAAAGAGVFGAVFGWVAQDSIRDLIGGLIIVAEDQFGVGDYIQSPLASGTVESFNLRCTRLRDSDGGVFTIPNNELRRMKNLSNQFSQVDYRVQIAHSDDLQRSLQALHEEALQLHSEWEDQITGEPRLLGVQKLAPEGITLRVLVRTRPGEQDGVERELNRRVKMRFDREGLELAQRWPRALPGSRRTDVGEE